MRTRPTPQSRRTRLLISGNPTAKKKKMRATPSQPAKKMSQTKSWKRE
jgi:hypothetical protein